MFILASRVKSQELHTDKIKLQTFNGALHLPQNLEPGLFDSITAKSQKAKMKAYIVVSSVVSTFARETCEQVDVAHFDNTKMCVINSLMYK